MEGYDATHGVACFREEQAHGHVQKLGDRNAG
jgi:hypothetical protein